MSPGLGLSKLRAAPAAAMLLLGAAPALAQRLGQAADADVPIWRVLGALAFCLALAVAAAILLKRRFGGPARASFGRGRRLQLVESLRLSHQTDLCIVSCDGAELLVAASPHGATLLNPALPAPPRPEPEA
jgi:flagellar biogenesis protein FliO